MSRSQPPAGAERLPSLTGLRFAAAAMVFGFHITLVPLLTGAFGRRVHFVLGLAGTAGVDFFFILSGFVLTWSARRGDTPGRFWGRRLAKIYPNHLVTLVAALVLAAIAGPKVVTGHVILNLFLIQTWFYGRTDIALSANPVAWSIAAEAVFYLCFPLLYRGVTRIRETRLWAGIGVISVLILSVPVLVGNLVSASPRSFQGPASDKQIWLVYYFPPIRMLEFVLGMILARIVAAGRWPRLGFRPALVVAVAGYVGVLYLPWFLVSISGVTAVVIAPLIAATASADIERAQVAGADAAGTAVGNRVWRWLGDRSYAFYMVHALVIGYGMQGLAHVIKLRQWTTLPRELTLVALLFVGALVSATLLYVVVERPVVRWWGARARRRAGGGGAAVGASQAQVLPSVAAPESVG